MKNAKIVALFESDVRIEAGYTCVCTNVHLSWHAKTGLYLYFLLTASWAAYIYYGIIVYYAYCKSKQNKRARAVIRRFYKHHKCPQAVIRRIDVYIK